MGSSIGVMCRPSQPPPRPPPRGAASRRADNGSEATTESTAAYTATGSDDDMTGALPRQTANNETALISGDAPPADPCAPPAPNKEPTATKFIVGDDAGTIEPRPATVVPGRPPLTAPSALTRGTPAASPESERARAAEGAAVDAMFVRAAATGEVQQSDLRAFVAPSADDASTDQAAAHLLWFLRELATLRDGVSGRTHAIDDVCVNLTPSEAKTREHASVALSSSEETKGAWAGPAALAANALLPHGISLRCVQRRRGVRGVELVLEYSYVCVAL